MIRFMSSSLMGGMSSSRSVPRARIVAGLPTFRCRSDPPNLIRARNSLLISSSPRFLLRPETPPDFAGAWAGAAADIVVLRQVLVLGIGKGPAWAASPLFMIRGFGANG